MPRLRAARLASQSERSEAIAGAYQHLIHLLVSDPDLSVLAELEGDRLRRQAIEYWDDAEDRRLRALELGFEPAS